MKILLGLTTTPGSDWRDKVREIKEFNIKEIALFPTFLNPEERKELYRLLEGTEVESIPHVHLRDDSDEEELDYLIDRFNVKVFNTHSNKSAINGYLKSKHADKIYVENHYSFDDELRSAVNNFAGACLDVAHWEDYGVIQSQTEYSGFEDFLKSKKIGCCHISAIRDYSATFKNYLNGEEVKVFSWHKYKELCEFNYLKKYVEYLPDLVSIELENSFEEQMLARDYIINLINKHE